MPIGIRYALTYIHKRKEVVLFLQVGTMPPIEIVMAAEAFCQDVDFMLKDQGLVQGMALIRERKDLPVDYDFGSGGQGNFNSKDWDDKMKGG